MTAATTDSIRKLRTVVLALLIMLAMNEGPVAQEAEPQAGPIHGFIRNDGQWATEARFVAMLGPMIIRAEPGSLVLQHEVIPGRNDPEESRSGKGTVVRLEWTGPFSDAEPVANGSSMPGQFHFLLGNDSASWRTGVPHYSSIEYRSPGVAGSLQISLQDTGGGLVVEARSGATLQGIVAGIDLTHEPTGAESRVRGETTAGSLSIRGGDFVNAAHGAQLVTSDGSLHLEWATYVGGLLRDLPFVLVHDALERPILGGLTYSSDFPTTPGAYDESWNGGTGTSPHDAFLSCLSEDGASLVFSTYLGGTQGNERVNGLVIEPSGSLLVGGRTSAEDFPTTPGTLKQVMGGADGFIARLSADGSTLLTSTYFGGSPGSDHIEDLVRMPDGRIVLVGRTNSATFPVTPDAVDTEPPATLAWDGFLAIVDEALTEVHYGTYLGGIGNDTVHAVALRPDGTVALTGDAASEFPVTAGAFQTTPGPGFAAVFDPERGKLVWSTFLSGAASRKVRVHSDGSLVIAGFAGTDFPATPGAFQTSYAGSTDGFVARIAANGASLHYATFLGSNGLEWLRDLALDSAGRATVVGSTNSGSYPTTPGAYQQQKPSINDEVFITRLDVDGSRLLYSSFWGGVGGEGSETVVLALTRTLGATVSAFSSGGFPTTEGTYDPTGGVKQGFKAVVARLTLMPEGTSRYGGPSVAAGQPDPVIGVTAMPKLGTQFGLTCVSVPEGVVTAGLVVSLAPLSAALPINGMDLWLDPGAVVAVLPVAVNADGYAVLELRLPDHAPLAGLETFWQFLGPLAPGGQWWSSDAVRVVLQR